MNTLQFFGRRTTRRAVFLFCLLSFLSGCVTTGGKLFSENVSVKKEVEARIQIAITYLQKDQPDPAITQLKMALDLDDKSAHAHEVMGLALEKTGEIETAIKHFKKMLSLDSSYSRGRSNYASFAMRQGEYKEAYKQFNTVVEDIYFPNRAIAYQQMAQCAQKLGKLNEVEPAYLRALSLDKTLTPALLGLANINYTNKKYPTAQQYLQKYRSQVKTSSAEALLLGIKLARVFEDKDEEASYALTLKNLYPRSDEYLEYLKNMRPQQ